MKINYDNAAAMTGAFVKLSARALRDGCREPNRSTRLGGLPSSRLGLSACALRLPVASDSMLEGFDLEVSVWPPAESAFATDLLLDEFYRRVQLVLYLFEDCV